MENHIVITWKLVDEIRIKRIDSMCDKSKNWNTNGTTTTSERRGRKRRASESLNAAIMMIAMKFAR